ncbi:MAG: hypothetical protein OEY67_04225 [Gammaproteobacteria bacterium]|nr:hypothetical protein [Gammaproteobacteria bacterium]
MVTHEFTRLLQAGIGRTTYFLAVLGLLLLALSACVTQPPPKEAGVDVLLSSDSPEYLQIAAHVGRQIPATMYRLTGIKDKDDHISALLRRSEHAQIIAVGFSAVNRAKDIPEKKVIFCQVFNYESLGLASSRTLGVSALPPSYRAFKIWKAIDPSLRRVGVVTGPNVLATINLIKQDALRNGIELEHAVVESDKELVFAFEKLSPQVQGFWLLPDNRILSQQVIQELMLAGFRQGKQLMVFTPAMLELGALLSVKPVAEEIAQTVTSIAQQDQSIRTRSGSQVIPLNRIDVKINKKVADQFGLSIPGPLQRLIYAP